MDILEEIIKEKEGNIEVDWKKFTEINNEDVQENILKKLEEKRILTHETKWKYAVNSNGIDSSPSSHSGKYYFNVQEDAEAYAEAKYSGALYPVYIMQFLGKIKNKAKK